MVEARVDCVLDARGVVGVLTPKQESRRLNFGRQRKRRQHGGVG